MFPSIVVIFFFCTSYSEVCTTIVGGPPNDDIIHVIQKLDRKVTLMGKQMDVRMIKIENQVISLIKRVDRYLPHVSTTTTTTTPTTYRSTTETPTPPPPTTTIKTTAATTTTTTTAPATDWVYFPPNTKKFRARKYYKYIKLQFIGFVHSYTSGIANKYPVKSMDECVKFCMSIRARRGPMWNGCSFIWERNGICQSKKYIRDIGGFSPQLQYVFL